MAERRVLTLPGLMGSGPLHWQTRWEAEHGFMRVEQEDWEHPTRSRWVKRLEQVLDDQPEPVVLAAHSLGCALVVQAAKRIWPKVAGALLVAPADVDDATRTPEEVRSFSPLPCKQLGFPATLVASRDDPYMAFERAAHFADCWEARFVDAGAVGHINAESGLGDWPAGYELLRELRRKP
jgi:predicted alpha/beta hydrolase family esterase